MKHYLTIASLSRKCWDNPYSIYIIYVLFEQHDCGSVNFVLFVSFYQLIKRKDKYYNFCLRGKVYMEPPCGLWTNERPVYFQIGNR